MRLVRSGPGAQVGINTGRASVSPALAAKRAKQDRFMAELHATLDLAAQDNHMKYERPSFTVVTASDDFRRGYDAIFTPQAPRAGDEPVPDSTPPRAGKEAP